MKAGTANIWYSSPAASLLGLPIPAIRKFLVFAVMIIGIVFANPTVDYQNPTAANGSTTSVNSTYMNISTNDTLIDTINIEFNGTNKTVDAPYIVFSMDFEQNLSIMQDRSRSGNNASVQGAYFNHTNGRIGSGYSFDGSDDFINSTSVIGIPSGNTPRAITVWFRAGGTAGNNALVGWGTEANAQASLLIISSNTLYFACIASPDDCDHAGATSVNDGLWHFATWTYDSDVSRIYLDGTLDATKNIANLNTVVGVASTTIGIGRRLGETSFYDGLIDEPRIYNKNLTQEEIRREMNRTSHGRMNATSFYANFTDLLNGTYTYRVHINTTSGAINTSQTRTITISTVSSEIDQQPTITITSAANITYSNSTPYNLTLNWTVSDDRSATLLCWRYIRNSQIAFSNVTNNTRTVETYLIANGGSYNFTVECQDSNSQNASATNRFHFAQGLNLTVVNAGNNSALNYTINITNSTASAVLTGAGISSFFDQSYFPKGNRSVTITLNISNYLYTTILPGYINSTITINETNITYLNLSFWRAQEFRSTGTPANFTINLTNSTRSVVYSTNTTRLWLSLGDIPWNTSTATVIVSVNSFGYNTISETRSINSAGALNISYSFLTSQLLLFVYNELDNTRIEFANVTISNSTTSQNYTNVNGTIALNLSLTPQNDITITVNALGGNRKYYMTLINNETRSLNTYFSNNQMYFYKFNVRSGSIFIEDALIQHQRYINGTFRTNVECKTQTGGDCTIYLEPAVIHKIIVSKTGYVTISRDREYSAADRDTLGATIYIIMETTGNVSVELLPINFWEDGNITAIWTLNASFIYEVTTINITITDAQNVWTYVWLNVTRANFTNGTEYFFSNNTGSSSYTFVVRLNTTGVYTYRLCFFRSGALNCLSRTFFMQSALQGFGNWSAVEYEKQGGLSVYTWKLASLIGISAIGGTVGLTAGNIGALLFMGAGFYIAGTRAIFTFHELLAIEFLIVILIFFAMRGRQ